MKPHPYDWTCPACGAQVPIPLAITTSPVHPVGEVRATVEGDLFDVRAHIATHVGPGTRIGIAS